MKMLLIGLGKHEGAKIYHRAIMNFSFEQILKSVAGHVLEQCRILAGVAIVENSSEETALIKAVVPQEFESREKELLILAKQWLPRLPFEEVDILIVDEIGKNLSGTGMDTNVVGRKFNDHKAEEDETPKVKRIAIRGLTAASHGNATGIGISEFCLQRVWDKVDIEATRVNCVTAGHLTAAMMPLVYQSDREMLTTAMQTIGLIEPPDAKILWIKNTLDLSEVECSAAYLDATEDRADLEVLRNPRPIKFSTEGFLSSLAEVGGLP